MKTPICDFVKGYSESNMHRLHMPGHKGKGLLGVEQFDITEISGADVLYSADGIIKESEDNASRLFNTAHTYYSTEGSSLCIKAMLLIAISGKEPVILASRNVHKSFVYGAALLNAKVEWLYPSNAEHLCSCIITPKILEQKLSSMQKLPAAVFITSPDYLGNVADIKGLSAVCHSFKVPLICDNAHGAYMNFLGENCHPIALGADMCCDSAHKTLPVLTGGAYLHISKSAPSSFLITARRALSVFASTSPSYLTLQSLDLCNKYLSQDYKGMLACTVEKVNALKQKLKQLGWKMLGTEPLKLTVDCADYGYSGFQVERALRKFKVECEFCDRDVVVLMFTPENDENAYECIYAALKSIIKKQSIKQVLPTASNLKASLSLNEALFSSQETVAIEASIGRICADLSVLCPPAVPIIMSGEVIDTDTVKILNYYNIKSINVVK